jgi:ubiquinone/menaquinone biosynthesis C-methylase UbiE
MIEGGTESHEEDTRPGELIRGFLEIKDGRLVVIPPDDQRRKDLIKQEQREWWNDSKNADLWSHSGVDTRDRSAVVAALEESQFYNGLRSGSLLLDLSVGAQSYLNPALLPEGLKIVNTDLSEKMLKKLKEVGQHPYDERFVAATATALPFDENTFDRSVTTFMMRYLTPNDQVEAVSEMIRTARPGGRADIFDFDEVFYPKEVYGFYPSEIKSTVNSVKFKQRLKDMGKKITAVDTVQIPRNVLNSSSRLFHMTLKVGE